MARTKSKPKPRPLRRTPSRAPRRWQLQDAKARFSQVVKDSRYAPQIITVHGEEVAVIQSIESYKKNQNGNARRGPNLFEELLKCPPGPPLIIDRDPNDTVGAGTPNIFE